MLIGKDFEKIKLDWFGLDLVDPNAFFGDMVIFVFTLFFYLRIWRMQRNEDFFVNWRRFYLWFGITFFTGGFGHLCFNYFEIWGKTPSWIFGMLPPFFIEQAMSSIFPNVKRRKIFRQISFVKLIVFIVAEIVVLALFDISEKPEKGLILPSICSSVSLIFCLGALGIFYQKRIHNSFKFLWIALIFLALSIVPQLLKINPHPYWDRNDLSHSFLVVMLILYFQTIKRYDRAHRKLFPNQTH